MKAKVYFKNYIAFENGDIYSRKKHRVMKPANTIGGYKQITLFNGDKRKIEKVHRIIAKCFVARENENNNVVTHIDGNRHNNKASNLQWSNMESIMKETHGKSNKSKKGKLIYNLSLKQRQQMRTNSLKYYHKNKEIISQKRRDYYQQNQERFHQYQRNYYYKNKDIYKAYYLQNKDAILQRQKLNQQLKNKELSNETNQ